MTAYTNVAATTEFRITFNSGANNGAVGIEYDDFTVNADVVPEPGSLALLGLGGLLIARRRRG